MVKISLLLVAVIISLYMICVDHEVEESHDENYTISTTKKIEMAMHAIYIRN